jgi:hypothetical protein
MVGAEHFRKQLVTAHANGAVNAGHGHGVAVLL